MTEVEPYELKPLPIEHCRALLRDELEDFSELKHFTLDLMEVDGGEAYQLHFSSPWLNIFVNFVLGWSEVAGFGSLLCYHCGGETTYEEHSPSCDECDVSQPDQAVSPLFYTRWVEDSSAPDPRAAPWKVVASPTDIFTEWLVQSPKPPDALELTLAASGLTAFLNLAISRIFAVHLAQV